MALIYVAHTIEKIMKKKKKSSVSSQSEKLIRMRQEDIILTEEMKAELRALDDIEPDMTDPDLPEITNWESAVVGKFYRPRKKQVTVRIDMDVLEWFKNAAPQYQTLMNIACREYMLRHQKNPKKAKRKPHDKKI